MPPRERRSDAGRRRILDALNQFGVELRRARLQHGLTQADVGKAAGISRSRVSRIECGLAPRLSFVLAGALSGAVGLDLSIRVYPGGSPMRDRAHLALIERFRVVVAASAAWQYEKPVPIPGDRRAWDIVLSLLGGNAGIEAETKPRDLQELLRRKRLRQRDDPEIQRVVLLLADTRHNRALLRASRDVIRAEFPGDPAKSLAALAEGRLPEQDTVLLL